MKFQEIPLDTFENMPLGAGIFLRDFDPKTGTFKKEDMIGATSGGAKFSAIPSFVNRGDGIDNIQGEVKELMGFDVWNIAMSGTYKTLSKLILKESLALADVDAEDSTHIILRTELKQSDFIKIWWVGDFGNKKGHFAIFMDNVLNTNGFTFQSENKGKGSVSFEYKSYFSQDNVNKVPCEFYLAEVEPTAATEPTPEVNTQSETYSTGKFDSLTEEKA